jgi:hypothetical protein
MSVGEKSVGEMSVGEMSRSVKKKVGEMLGNLLTNPDFPAIRPRKDA